MFRWRPTTLAACSPLLSATVTFVRSSSQWIPCVEPIEGRQIMPIARYALLLLSMLSPAFLGAATVKDGFFTTSDGVRLHYLESGAGPTIVFVPGWTMPAEIWGPQIEAFAHRYHVVAFDPRGQGDSAVASGGYEPGRRGEDIADLVATLGPAPVVLVGWSL